MIRLAGMSCTIAAAMLQTVYAHDVRHLTFAASLVGIWGATQQACDAKDKSNLEIAESQYVDGGVTCAVDYIVETAARIGANYGVHAMCADPAQPAKRTVANLLIRPQGDGRIIVAGISGDQKVYQRCSSK